MPWWHESEWQRDWQAEGEKGKDQAIAKGDVDGGLNLNESATLAPLERRHRFVPPDRLNEVVTAGAAAPGAVAYPGAASGVADRQTSGNSEWQSAAQSGHPASAQGSGSQQQYQNQMNQYDQQQRQIQPPYDPRRPAHWGPGPRLNSNGNGTYSHHSLSSGALRGDGYSSGGMGLNTSRSSGGSMGRGDGYSSDGMGLNTSRELREAGVYY